MRVIVFWRVCVVLARSRAQRELKIKTEKVNKRETNITSIFRSNIHNVYKTRFVR